MLAALVAPGLVRLTPAGVPVMAAAVVAPGRPAAPPYPPPARRGRDGALVGRAGRLAAGCYALKLAGLSVPEEVLDRPAAQRIADLLPVALMAALVVVQTFAAERAIAIDARAAGLAVAVVALCAGRRSSSCVGLAALTAALLRLVT